MVFCMAKYNIAWWKKRPEMPPLGGCALLAQSVQSPDFQPRCLRLAAYVLHLVAHTASVQIVLVFKFSSRAKVAYGAQKELVRLAELCPGQDFGEIWSLMFLW